MDADLRARAIVERLIDRLHDATVDYRCEAGVHEFIVSYGGSRFTIRFSEGSLLRRGMHELEQAAAQIADRIRSNSTARAVA
jgi:hypothetical protein